MKIIIYDIELKDIGKSNVELVQEYSINLDQDELIQLAHHLVGEFEESAGLQVISYAWKEENE